MAIEKPRLGTTQNDLLHARDALNLVSQLLQSNIALGYIARCLLTGDHVRKSKPYTDHLAKVMTQGVNVPRVTLRIEAVKRIDSQLRAVVDTLADLSAEAKDERYRELKAQFPGKNYYDLNDLNDRVLELEQQLMNRVNAGKGSGGSEQTVEARRAERRIERALDEKIQVVHSLPEFDFKTLESPIKIDRITITGRPKEKVLVVVGPLQNGQALDALKTGLSKDRPDLANHIDDAFAHGTWGYDPAADEQIRQEVKPFAEKPSATATTPKLKGAMNAARAMNDRATELGDRAGGSQPGTALDRVLNATSPALSHATQAMANRTDLGEVYGKVKPPTGDEIAEFFAARGLALAKFKESQGEMPDNAAPFRPLMREHFLALLMQHVHKRLPLRLAEDLGNLSGLLLRAVAGWHPRDASAEAFLDRFLTAADKPLSAYFDILTPADLREYENLYQTQCIAAERDTQDLCDDVEGLTWMLDAVGTDSAAAGAEVMVVNMSAKEFAEADWPNDFSDPIYLRTDNPQTPDAFLPGSILVTRSAQRWSKADGTVQNDKFDPTKFLQRLDDKWREGHGGRCVVPPVFIATPRDRNRANAISELKDCAKEIADADVGFPAFALGPPMALGAEVVGRSPFYFLASRIGLTAAAKSIRLTAEPKHKDLPPLADMPAAAGARLPATAVVTISDHTPTVTEFCNGLLRRHPLAPHLFAFEVSVVLRSEMGKDLRAKLPREPGAAAAALAFFQALVIKMPMTVQPDLATALQKSLPPQLPTPFKTGWHFAQVPNPLAGGPVALTQKLFFDDPWVMSAGEATKVPWLAKLLKYVAEPTRSPEPAP